MESGNISVVDFVTLQRDLYIAMSLLLADQAVDKLGDPFQWTGEFYEKEVRRLLLWVAVAVRSLLDPIHSKRKLENQKCGEYWANFPSGKSIDLILRQACNSIIHAEEVHLHRIQKQKTLPAKVVYSDRITVRSSYQNKPTRTQIDIIQFAKSINTLTKTLGNSHANLPNGL